MQSIVFLKQSNIDLGIWFISYSQLGLSKRWCIYILSDGIYCKVWMYDKLCLLVVISIEDVCCKKVLAVVDESRESEVNSKHDVVLNIPKQRSA
ncbi:hypothetical protein [Candidatus Enterovibrio escicola]|uniref:hypothetical protein n=1 Tax=Candidatus Enterovibrio escicola TaxID=1927127 RepID=UPI001237E7AA|nr:hypothetical protein [Candidatus Enterovibrio escacola]